MRGTLPPFFESGTKKVHVSAEAFYLLNTLLDLPPIFHRGGVKAGALLQVQEVLLELIGVKQPKASDAVPLLRDELVAVVDGLGWTLFSTGGHQSTRLREQPLAPLVQHSHAHLQSPPVVERAVGSSSARACAARLRIFWSSVLMRSSSMWIRRRSRSESAVRQVPTLSRSRAAIFNLAVWDNRIASCRRFVGTASPAGAGGDGFELIGPLPSWAARSMGVGYGPKGPCTAEGAITFSSSRTGATLARCSVKKNLVLRAPVRWLAQSSLCGARGSSPSMSSSTASAGCWCCQWRPMVGLHLTALAADFMLIGKWHVIRG